MALKGVIPYEGGETALKRVTTSKKGVTTSKKGVTTSKKGVITCEGDGVVRVTERPQTAAGEERNDEYSGDQLGRA